jgi:hypothetical protein
MLMVITVPVLTCRARCSGKKIKQLLSLGYFVAGEFIFREDGRPTATGVYKVKDDVLANLEKTPSDSLTCCGGTFYNPS